MSSSEKAVVLKAFIHCEGCADKIYECLKGFDGVERVAVDKENHKIIVKGEVVNDPLKVLERLRKNYSKHVQLIAPKPKPDNKQKDPEEKEQAEVKTVVLKMYIHCEGCANDVKRKIEKMKGVVSVEVSEETSHSHVIVRGEVEPTKLVKYVNKKLGKHAEIIKEDEVESNENCPEHIIMFSYPPQYSTEYLYPCQIFSDENAFACSIM
ncbi:heavy metal-associated isoprenylated plant protein 8 [Gastrolobium bilobum]|uniref:heavy metal-associated isoprenylated plant protein 8 n=1 Tax=Gastrolobium bilobum TaxID=150636 RepID=UPI002AB065AA|nr:heavy metal-associated isoprenylated plant protein 8 [Gastrolobium bilobum]